jgi:hypothetical protein
MGDLWWAEAAIAADRTPDWQAAYAAISGLSRDDIPQWDEYVDGLEDELHMTDGGVHGARHIDASGRRWESLLLSRVRDVMRTELEHVVDAVTAGAPRVCAFEVAGFRVYVHCSGYGSAPDRLCESWLRLDALGLLRVAGFVETRTLDWHR